jgi:uncharacterized membrane protein
VTISETSAEPVTPESVVEIGRLGSLTDAVFAVALTLLVLDIRLPEGTLVGDVPARLLELAPKLLVYLISFVIIGGAWGSHQRMFSQIKRGDGLLVWFNLFSLLFVTLLPASAALLGSFPDNLIAVICFAVDVIFIQLTAWLLWRHASKHSLINPFLDPRVVAAISRRLNLSTVAVCLSIPLALIHVGFAYALWLGLFILLFTTDWLSWQQAIKTQYAIIPLNGAGRAHLHLQHSAGNLHLGAEASEGALATGTFGGGLLSQTKREGESMDVQIRPPERPGFMSWRFPWAWSRANTLDWMVDLNKDLPIILDVETSGGQADLDLSDLRITKLDLKTSASSITLALPAHVAQTMVSIEATVSSLSLHVPAGVAALIHTDEAPGVEVDPDRFTLVKDTHEYRTVDYETAANRADVRICMAIGSVKIA